MRVLLLDENKNYEVHEITIICQGTNRDISNLCMCNTDGNWISIKNVPEYECNDICRKILETGYYDLTRYGEYEYDDD